jgi:hypothetical protein
MTILVQTQIENTQRSHTCPEPDNLILVSGARPQASTARPDAMKFFMCLAEVTSGSKTSVIIRGDEVESQDKALEGLRKKVDWMMWGEIGGYGRREIR